MATHPDDREKRVYKVIRSDELEKYTREGWQRELTEFEEDEPMPVVEAHKSVSGGDYESWDGVPVVVAATKRKFIVSIEITEYEDANNLREHLEKATEELTKVSESSEKREALCASLNHKVLDLENELKTAKEEYWDVRRDKDGMLLQLNTLRKALGQIEFDKLTAVG